MRFKIKNTWYEATREQPLLVELSEQDLTNIRNMLGHYYVEHRAESTKELKKIQNWMKDGGREPYLSVVQPELYKIRRKTDGLFSNGGTSPTFSKEGHIWKRKIDVKRHLELFTKPHHKTMTLEDVYRDCEVVCFQLNQKLVQDVLDFNREYN